MFLSLSLLFTDLLLKSVCSISLCLSSLFTVCLASFSFSFSQLCCRISFCWNGLFGANKPSGFGWKKQRAALCCVSADKLMFWDLLPCLVLFGNSKDLWCLCFINTAKTGLHDGWSAQCYLIFYYSNFLQYGDTFQSERWTFIFHLLLHPFFVFFC